MEEGETSIDTAVALVTRDTLEQTKALEVAVMVRDNAVEEKNPLLTLDPGISIWAIVVFALLLALLTRFAWKPLLAGIDAREVKLRNAVEQAEQSRISNRRTQEMRQKILDDAKQQASDIVAQARITAEALARNIEQEAQNEREAIISSAQLSIDAKQLTAKQELKEQAIDLSFSITEKLLKEKIDDERSRRLVEKMIKELEEQS
jgi:F-type H+-transporting ATPase subunit b